MLETENSNSIFSTDMGYFLSNFISLESYWKDLQNDTIFMKFEKLERKLWKKMFLKNVVNFLMVNKINF